MVYLSVDQPHLRMLSSHLWLVAAILVRVLITQLPAQIPFHLPSPPTPSAVSQFLILEKVMMTETFRAG